MGFLPNDIDNEFHDLEDLDDDPLERLPVVEDVFDKAEREYKEHRECPTLPALAQYRAIPQPSGFHGGYTTVQKKLRENKAQLVLHRKKRREWAGTKEAWEAQERWLLGCIGCYRDVLAQPYYANKIRKAANRKRRVKRQPLVSRYKVVSRCRYTGNEVRNEFKAHLKWMVLRVKKKRFKSMQHLAYVYRKPMKWIREAKAEAIKSKLISETKWKVSFRGPGRPRKGKPRGPYKKQNALL